MIWLRLPDSWPQPVAAAVALLLLTALDLTGTIAAKEAVEHRSALFAAAGAVVFVVMFWVFASTLRITGLVVVTVSWCVLVQVSVLLLNRLHYGEELPPGKLLAVILALAAQVYLLAGPAGGAPEPVPSIPAITLVSRPLVEPVVRQDRASGGVGVAVPTGRHVASGTDRRPVAVSSRPTSVGRVGRHLASSTDRQLPIFSCSGQRPARTTTMTLSEGDYQ